MTATLEIVPRAKSTPKNPHGAAVGQQWTREQHVRSNDVAGLIVKKVDIKNGVAICESTKAFRQFGGKPRVTRIKLARLQPRHGYTLVEAAS